MSIWNHKRPWNFVRFSALDLSRAPLLGFFQFTWHKPLHLSLILSFHLPQHIPHCSPALLRGVLYAETQYQSFCPLRFVLDNSFMTWPLSPFSGGDSPAVQSTSNQGWLNQEDGAMSSLIELLRHFEAPGVPPPPSARVGDPKLKQREGKPIRLWDLWRYGAFVAVKGKHIPLPDRATGVRHLCRMVPFEQLSSTLANVYSLTTTHIASQLVTALVSHHVRGPPKKSWGIEMTLLTCIMRDVGHHSHLADIVSQRLMFVMIVPDNILIPKTMVRMLMGIGGLVPVPSDALVTPVTFRVRKRALRGILSEFDALEDGSRELSGEWVVGKRTWQRLQHEWQASKKSKSESPIAQVRHQPKRKERVILYIHGGKIYSVPSCTVTHRNH